MSDFARQLNRASLISNFGGNTIKKKPATATVQYLQARMNLLEKYWTEFYNCHTKLMLDPDFEENDYCKNGVFDDVQNDYIMFSAELQTEIDKLNVAMPTNSATVSSNVPSSSSSYRRIPVLNIPKFSGRQQDWETFKELFCSIIRDDSNLTPVEKLQHLLNSVEGAAASSLKGIKVVGANFNVAWEKLLRRYDNNRIRLSTHLDNLINLKQISKKNAADINLLLDAADEAVKGLTDLGCPVDQYDVWLVHLISRKLDGETREDWEISEEECKDFSTYDSLRKFLESRVRSLEQAQFSTCQISSNFKERKTFNSNFGSKSDSKMNSFKHKSVNVHVANKSKSTGFNIVCKFCSGSHKLRDCELFKRSSVVERRAKVMQLKLCINCLSKDHRAADCPSSSKCFICEERHHVKLHVDKYDGRNKEAEHVKEPEGHCTEVKAAYVGNVGTPILLATAEIKLVSPNGDTIMVRALIDPGAEASFISQRVVDVLCLPRQVANISVSGVGATKSGVAKMKTNVILSSKVDSGFSMCVPMLIMEKLTTDVPRCTLKTKDWSHLSGLELADPYFYRPSRIGCILGADVYGAVLKEGVIRGPPDTPIAQETQFGWVLTGLTGGDVVGQGSKVNNVIQSLHVSLSSVLEQFWEIEQIPTKSILSEEDEFCEQLYRNTTVRESNGRYVVRLPVKEKTEFPSSREIALSCLLRGEKRLARQPELRKNYSDFLGEYEDLGHMQLAKPGGDDSSIYYLPHHSVIGTNGKIRVVFNASQKCKNGMSLNDILYPGPRLQQELSAVISRWRLGRYAFSCDIVKMFRQILVAEEDRNLQRILWRPRSSDEVQEFKLLTVTYGTAPAPFLAIRTLLQLAEDENTKFPEAADLLRKLSYVDDIYGSGDTLETVLGLRNQLISLLRSAGMELSKWSANIHELLDALPEETISSQALELNTSVSTLGLLWFPGNDLFSFKYTLDPNPPRLTKRSILSEIAKLFDPLGWLTPVIVQGKILMQDLWISGPDWDSQLSDDFSKRWLKIREDFLTVQEIRIPRWIGGTSASLWTIHGFCDASSRAYAAAVYLKANGSKPYLLMAKSKVAPLKTLSIPRLELCGALLLARLVQFIILELSFSPVEVICWTDSSVVLAWLKHHPSKWTTFVANRVSQIMEFLPNTQWKYVSTSENPADCASRGMSAHHLKDFNLWWHGPVWLNDDNTQWLQEEVSQFETDLEMKTQSAAYNVRTEVSNPLSNSLLESLERFSSLSQVIPVLAYILRWRKKFKEKQLGSSYLSVEELKTASTVLYRMVQNEYFSEDIRLIRNNLPVPKKSPLVRLKPFLDDNQVLRLGGRLQYSKLPYDEKHPILLPRNCHFSRLLVKEAHHITLHGGPQLMQSWLNRKYWILQSKRLVQSVYRRCVKCVRYDANTVTQQMAPLPSYRLEPRRPFALTGLDYAGPFPVRAHKGRGHTSCKGYVSIFICMVTRAVHLEIVSDLTTAAFLAAYRRFTARRGNCSAIYSDNATTFHGAATELKELFSETSSFSEELSRSLAKEGTSWFFIPPRAPHFGGLWEAAVRSFKHHLKRVIGESALTYEEFSTLAAQIEACLNSRPLCPMSTSPEDVSALTPGHFLIGAPLKAPPEPFDETDLTRSLTSRWKHLLVMRNHFWIRWRKEVLQQFQQRNKWLATTDSVQVGDLVLIKDDQQPPTRWSLGRVSKLYSGPDGLIRVADVRTAYSTLRRPLVKLVRIPNDQEAVSAYSAMIVLH